MAKATETDCPTAEYEKIQAIVNEQCKHAGWPLGHGVYIYDPNTEGICLCYCK